MSDTNGFGGYGGGRGGAPAHIAARKSNQAPPQPIDLQKILARPPWDQHKPPTAQDFYSFTPDSLTLAAGAGSTVSTTAATGGFVNLGQDAVGILQTVIFTIDVPTTAMSIRLSVFAGGSAIPGLSNIGFPPINASSFAFPLTSVWQLSQGVNLFATFTNLNAAGPWTVGIVLSGYQVLASDIAAYTGERVGMIETAGDLFKKNLAR